MHHAPCWVVSIIQEHPKSWSVDCLTKIKFQKNIIQSCQNMALLLTYILYIFHAIKIHSMTHVGQGHGYPRVGE